MWQVLLSLISAHVAADFVFYNPPASGPTAFYEDDVVWEIGSLQTIHWSTNLSDYGVVLWQDHPDGSPGGGLDEAYRPNGDGSGDHSFQWTVQLYESNLSYSNVYYFWLDSGDPAGFTSHYFNITNSTTLAATNDTTPSTTSSSATISSTATKTSPTITPSPTTTTPKVIASQIATTSDPTLALSLGISLGVGVPLLLAVVGWVAVKKSRRRKGQVRPPMPIDPAVNREIEAFSDLPPGWTSQKNDEKISRSVPAELPTE